MASVFGYVLYHNGFNRRHPDVFFQPIRSIYDGHDVVDFMTGIVPRDLFGFAGCIVVGAHGLLIEQPLMSGKLEKEWRRLLERAGCIIDKIHVTSKGDDDYCPDGEDLTNIDFTDEDNDELSLWS